MFNKEALTMYYYINVFITVFNEFILILEELLLKNKHRKRKANIKLSLRKAY